MPRRHIDLALLLDLMVFLVAVQPIALDLYVPVIAHLASNIAAAVFAVTNMLVAVVPSLRL